MKLAPIPAKMTRVIAGRDLVLVVGRKRYRVRIQIGRPVHDVQTVSGFDWRCPLVVWGVGLRRARRGLGADSLQALVDALKALELEIDELERKSSGHFEWVGEQWHGIPAIRRRDTVEVLRRGGRKRGGTFRR